MRFLLVVMGLVCLVSLRAEETKEAEIYKIQLATGNNCFTDKADKDSIDEEGNLVISTEREFGTVEELQGEGEKYARAQAEALSLKENCSSEALQIDEKNQKVCSGSVSLGVRPPTDENPTFQISFVQTCKELVLCQTSELEFYAWIGSQAARRGAGQLIPDYCKKPEVKKEEKPEQDEEPAEVKEEKKASNVKRAKPGIQRTVSRPISVSQLKGKGLLSKDFEFALNLK